MPYAASSASSSRERWKALRHALGFRRSHFPALSVIRNSAGARHRRLPQAGSAAPQSILGKQPLDDSIERPRAQLHFPPVRNSTSFNIA